MARIAWIEDEEAQGTLAQLYETIRSGSVTGTKRDRVSDILKTMSLRPDFLAAIMEASRMHFSDGALTRAQHEMIASYVSAINRCHYWLSSHTWFLQLQGEQFKETAMALREGNLERAKISPAEKLLLEFVGTLTRHAYRITDEQVQELREAGWSDAQIAEAVYDGALFNMFVRLADAFDIHPPAIMDPDGLPEVVKKE